MPSRCPLAALALAGGGLLLAGCGGPAPTAGSAPAQATAAARSWGVWQGFGAANGRGSIAWWDECYEWCMTGPDIERFAANGGTRFAVSVIGRTGRPWGAIVPGRSNPRRILPDE